MGFFTVARAYQTAPTTDQIARDAGLGPRNRHSRCPRTTLLATGRRTATLLVGVFAAAIATGACSVFPSLDGLSGGGVPPPAFQAAVRITRWRTSGPMPRARAFYAAVLF